MSDVLENPTIQGQANSQNTCSGLTPNTPPSLEEDQIGQSVRSILTRNKYLRTRRWFAVRATQGRAKTVYEKLLALNFEDIQPYLPLRKTKKTDISDFNKPVDYTEEVPLISSLLFLNCTTDRFKEILHLNIPGFTPYYDHFSLNNYGYNDYLVIPDKQFDDFRRIVESDWDDVIVDPSAAPDFLVGDHVRVTEGPYAGIEGIVMKYKHQRRVFVQLNGIGNFGTGYIYKGFLEKIPATDSSAK